VNDKKIQQGLVRFAVRDTAPNKQGPMEPVTATITSVTDGVVTATVPSNWDRDDKTLTYRLYRGPADATGLTPANATLVASQDVTSTFFSRSTVTLTDSAVRPGTTASYLVTVSDPYGNTVPAGDAVASAWRQVKVAGAYRNADPVASFTATTDGLKVAVDGTASTDDSAVVSYAWDFGDGTASVVGVTASHTYATAGTYQVGLTVTDDEGATGTTARQITVTAPGAPDPGTDPDPGQVPDPGQDPTAPAAGTLTAWYEATVTGSQVSLDGSGSCDCDGQIVSYQWEFGDGTTGAGVTATHTFQQPGTYRVLLIVTDDKGLVSAVYSEIAIKP